MQRHLLPFGAALAGRLLTDQLVRARLLAVLAVVACCYVVVFAYGMTRPHPPANDQAIPRPCWPATPS